jgi:hypothetical protein
MHNAYSNLKFELSYSSIAMGYLYFCSRIVYGFHDVRNSWGDGKMLDRDSCPTGVDVYAGEINKRYNICPIIGIECGLTDNGTVFIPNEAERQSLLEFMEECKSYYTSIGIAEDIIRDIVVPSYHLVMSGDWECHEIYTISSNDCNCL